MILVTGASGVIGSQILRALVKNNVSVRATKRNSSDISWTNDINQKIDWVEADILDIMMLERAFKEVTHVVHCAAIVSFNNSKNDNMNLINVEGTKNVLALSQKYKIKKFVHLSSVAALGRTAQKKSINENHKWVPSELNSAYGVSKHLAELEVWRAQEEGLPTVILNPSVVIGPGNWNNSSVKLFRHVKNGSSFYMPGNFNFIDVRDVASIACTFLFNETQGQRYILNAGSVSYHKFFNTVAKAMNKKAPSVKVNFTLAIFAASVLKIVQLVTGIKSDITKEAVVSTRLSHFYSTNKIERALDFKFKELNESINWTWEQLKTNHLNIKGT